MNFVPRELATASGLTRYFTGIPCKYGHIAERLVSNGRCVECGSLRSREWKHAHLDVCTAEKREWRKRNRGRVNALKRSRYEASEQERRRQAVRSRRWLEDNREKSRASSAKWRKANLATAAAAASRRKAKLLQRTPSWADHEKIRQFYVQSRELTEQTGIEHEVDHIYPLQGEFVSGFHVETNLRVVPKSVNRAKGARVL